MSRARPRWQVLAVAFPVALLLATVTFNSTAWIGRTFPGFLLMANRVVPSISLPEWEAANDHALFQHQVIALDGRPVATADEVYRLVAAAPPRTSHVYELRSPAGTVTTVEARSRRFSGREYGLLFGLYLSTGAAFVLTGLVVAWLKRGPASFALLVQCLTTGVFVITAADLYGPHWFFRLHVVAEAMLAAGFVHLALVFPTDRLKRRRKLALAAVYLPGMALAAAYQFALATPSAYTRMHLIASATHGVGALAIIAAAVYDLATTRSPLVRRRVGVVAMGTFGAFALPGGLMAASALLGGSVPLNVGAFTAFVFPLSLGYAIVKQDLFEIDVMLRRAVTYAVTLTGITAAYFAALALVGVLTPLHTLSPVAMAVVNLGILLLIAPIKARAQAAVDRVFFRTPYDAERVLSALSQELSSARTLADVDARTRAVLVETFRPETASLWLSDDGVAFRSACGDGATTTLILPSDAGERLAAGAIVTRYRWDDEPDALPVFWRAVDAEIMAPIRSGAFVIGALTLGRKGSGRSYNDQDTVFLAAVASQVGLAITNASAFSQLADLNASLEDQVRERTAALELANRDLNRSYSAMQSAFQQLEQSQNSLMRADRLATLGRLAASVAHEVNTPLGAILNSLQILGDLGREYQESVDDATVTPEDHREIAHEIVATAGAATGWARKAAAFIMRVKTHGRDPRGGARRPFAIADVVEETRALLGQRLRLECCALTFEEEPAGLTIVGDPGQLGQVLVNLVTNALDAYEEAHSMESRIAVSARLAGGAVEVTVQDWAGGMPPEVAARIFDELYTTKDPGRGTGLGLCIARNLVEESFAGSLAVETSAGVGSRFVIRVPVAAAVAADAAVATA